ncbi:unnamed protein product [Onchocerca ochengi]|uniref:NPH3 domain-containing protein n=1 Tax=Onchocerca ochengi TaxID=42157 RepID=A0A182EF85_ONCOC|nr:unnamed protein product [Onchocerca ochengi]
MPESFKLPSIEGLPNKFLEQLRVPIADPYVVVRDVMKFLRAMLPLYKHAANIQLEASSDSDARTCSRVVLNGCYTQDRLMQDRLIK